MVGLIEALALENEVSTGVSKLEAKADSLPVLEMEGVDVVS